MTLLITIIAATMLISAACSLFEATLYSTRVGALQAAVESGTHSKPARVFLKMKDNIGSPTSAILILNTVANTAGATLAGVVAANELGASAMPVVSVGLTLGILFLSEILPKTVGATQWQTFWPYIVYPLRAMEQALKPFIFVTQKFSNIFTGGAGAPSVTEDEIQASIHLGQAQGELSRNELQLISAVFRFDEMIVRQIIVPRREVSILKKHQPVEEIFDVVRQGRHTRYPVCEDSLDDVVGLLHIKDLMAASSEERQSWNDLIRPVRSVPANMPISRLLRQMQSTRQHMAVVLDEHGSSSGIVTLENVLEQIVGAVQDEFDMEAPEFETQGPDSFIVAGSLSIERLNQKLRLDLYASGVDTLAGLLTSRLGRLVKVGDVVDLPGVRAEVTEVRDDHPAKVHLTLDRDLRWTSENAD